MNINNNKKIAVWGFWNGKNLGDLWILESMKKRFQNLTPLNVNQTKFDNYNFLIIGGGGLLNGPLLRKPFDNVNALTIPFGTIGIGGEFPILEYNKVEKFIKSSQFFGVRDSYNVTTYNFNNSSAVNNKLEISGDCTFLYPLKNPVNLLQNYNIKEIRLIWRDPYQLLKWHTSPEHSMDGQVLNQCFKDYQGDLPFNNNQKCLEHYKKLLSQYGKITLDTFVVEKVFPSKLADRFKGTDLIVSMRYHGVIVAIQMNIPVIALDIYPKVRTIMREVGLEKYCIKLSEFDKIQQFIKEFKSNAIRSQIIKKMSNYTAKNTKLINNFCDKIDATLNMK